MIRTLRKGSILNPFLFDLKVVITKDSDLKDSDLKYSVRCSMPNSFGSLQVGSGRINAMLMMLISL